MNVTIQGKNQKYLIKGDAENLTINPINIVKDGKNKGKETLGTTRNFPRLEQLIDALYHLELTDSDSKTVRDMLTCILATRRLIKTAGFAKE